MKPRVLISRSPESRGLYEQAVEKAGGEVLSLYCPDPDLAFDALILGGGGDVDPAEFMEPNLGSREIDVPRDKAELALVSRCVAENKPILGICRGHQVVNIALGGNIYQDMNARLVALHGEDSEGKPTAHAIQIAPYTLLHQLYGSEMLVNSSHHQAIRQFGQGLYRTAWDENGVVEAMEHSTLPIWTFQFHPEQMLGEDSAADGQKMFDFFLEQCRKHCGG